MAGRQQTAPPQQRRSKDDTAHPHQPGASPEPPHPDPAHHHLHHPTKAKVKFPLWNRISLKACLASFMCIQGLVHGNTEVEWLMECIDSNKDVEIDFGEFRDLTRTNSVETLSSSVTLFSPLSPSSKTSQTTTTSRCQSLSSCRSLHLMMSFICSCRNKNGAAARGPGQTDGSSWHGPVH